MTIKIALVGTGNIASSNYLPYLVKHEDVELSYYNRTPSRAQEVAERFGGRVATSVADLMADNPDSVLVLTRETDRYAATKALLACKPRRLFFEKPLVAQYGQANVVEDDFSKGKELLELAAASGTETAMVFNYRFFDQTRKARAILTKRKFGRPLLFTGLVHYACWSHCIDLLHYFVGPIAEVSALASQQERTRDGGRATDVTAAMRTRDDATGTLIGTYGLDFALPLYELTFAFEGGRIHMRDLDGDMEMIEYDTRRHELHSVSRHVSRWQQYDASFGKSIDAYLQSIRLGAPPPVPGLAGLRELQVEAAIKRSIAQRRPVALDVEFPIPVTES